MYLIRPIRVEPSGERWVWRWPLVGATFLLTACFTVASGLYISLLFSGLSRGFDPWPILGSIPFAAWFARAGWLHMMGGFEFQVDLRTRTLALTRRRILRTESAVCSLDNVVVQLVPARDRGALAAMPSVVLRIADGGWAFVGSTRAADQAESVAEEISARWRIPLERSAEPIVLPLRYGPGRLGGSAEFGTRRANGLADPSGYTHAR